MHGPNAATGKERATTVLRRFGVQLRHALRRADAWRGEFTARLPLPAFCKSRTMTALIAVFALYGWLGFRIGRTARSPFQQLLAVGLTATTLITAYLHIGVVVGLLPTTGLTLPFISYGRSNLILSLVMTGVLVNIGSARERIFGSHATDPHGVAG